MDDLFSSIPASVRQRGSLNLPEALDERSLMKHLTALAQKNVAPRLTSFLGAGAYEHHFPAAADQLLTRSEFLTAYTPYQPEVAQGTLQVIFEFQTIVSEILGLPVANASMYDASTALAEAVLMARRLTGRDRTLVSGGIHPEHLQTLHTYVASLPGGARSVEVCPLAPSGQTDLTSLRAALSGGDPPACVVIGYPNFFGCVEDLRPIAEAAHAVGALLISTTPDPYALALLEPPGALGADIAVAEGQPLGLPPQYGGPGVGLLACKNDRKFLQQLPGRVVGETLDSRGMVGYVLTLATREQHIRRERATSNICTNSGLCATAVTIKMALLGKSGFVRAAQHCFSNAEYLKAELAKAGVRPVHSARTFNEFAVELGRDASVVATALVDSGLLAGLALGRFFPERATQLLVSTTECHNKADLDALVSAIRGLR